MRILLYILLSLVGVGVSIFLVGCLRYAYKHPLLFMEDIKGLFRREKKESKTPQPLSQSRIKQLNDRGLNWKQDK